METFKEHIFVCDCHRLDHMFKLSFDSEDGELYLTCHLNTYNSFFKRIIIGIKYIFGYKSRFGNFDEVVVNVNDKDKLFEIVNAFKAYHGKK